MRFILFILMISVVYGSEFDLIKDNIKDAKIIIVGNVIESVDDSHLIKINKWAKGDSPKSKFIKVHANRTLERLQTYMFAIDDIQDDHFWVNDPTKGVYELKSMGDYKFLVRAYNSDMPLIGQIELDSLIDYVRKDLEIDVKSIGSDRFDRKISQIYTANQVIKRFPASSKVIKKTDSKVSEVWLITIFCFFILVTILLRKTRL